MGCSLHQGELPLRHVISEIDGKTNDPKKYKGAIGEQASGIFMDEQPLIQFVPIDSEIELYVNPDIVCDLSTDQCKLYEYCVGIAKCSISIKYANKKPGPVSHAQWLTLALRIMMVYARTEIPTHDLNCVTRYIIQVNCPMWFAVKISGYYKDAPRLLHKTIELVKKQDERIQKIVLKNLQSNSFCCCQENFLCAMPLENEKVVRDLALNQILQIRLS